MAGIISKETIEQVRQSLDIADVIGSYIQLKRAGNSMKALCPFHKEKTPSFTVNPARQAFHCFGCGAGGDVFKFVMLFENVDFPTAVRLLASRAGVAIAEEAGSDRSKEGPRKDDLFKANEEASRLYLKELLENPAAGEARAYLEGRFLGIEVCKDWGIGYAPDSWGFLSDKAGAEKKKILDAAGLLSANDKGKQYDRFRDRVMFTIRDELGRAVGFSGRILKPGEKTGGKYVNTPETPVFRKSRILFGLDKGKREILDARKAILCEGQIDCIRCHLAGFPQAVASQGTAFTEEHARLLKRYADHIVIVLDADAAGRKAALRSAELLLDEGLVVSLAALLSGEDPDTLLLKDGGRDQFRSLLDNALTPMGFLIGMFRERGNMDTPEGRLRAIRAVVDLAGHAQGAVQREQMLREAATELNVGLDSLMQDANRSRRKMYRPAASAESKIPAGGPVSHPVDEMQLACLLVSDESPEVAGLVRRWLPYPLISDSACRTVIHILAEEEEPDLMAALDEEEESAKAVAARIVNMPSQWKSSRGESTALQGAQDVILSIWKRYLQRKRNRLSERLQTLEEPERQAVQEQFAQLLADLSGIKGGWEKARLILECHLHQMAEEC